MLKLVLGMALSSLSRLQLTRTLLLFLILLDVVGSTVLLLRLGSGEEFRETLVDQVAWARNYVTKSI